MRIYQWSQPHSSSPIVSNAYLAVYRERACRRPHRANEEIGYNMLTALVEDGYRVACLDIRGSSIDSLQESHTDTVRYYECDVTAAADVERTLNEILAEWGGIDVLVNNAAVQNFGFFQEQPSQDLKRVFEVNFFGYVRMIRAVLQHMRARDDGIIDNLRSGVGRVGNPGLTGYAATNGAIESFTRSLRHELRQEEVKCTIMHPRLANTRSAQTLDFPESQLNDPEYVGRKLAGKIESTNAVIYTDRLARIGLALAQRFPSLVKRSTERFL